MGERRRRRRTAISHLNNNFTSLNRHIQRSEFEHAVKISDQGPHSHFIISSIRTFVYVCSPGDEDALRCKAVALIRADSFEKALSTIQSSQKFPTDFSFFKAYCLYRQNKLDEALESMKSQEKDSATMLLESQILYRLGIYEACLDIYRALQKSKIHSLEINFVTGLVSAGKSSELQ